MARIRSIHPGIWTDEAFMSVSGLARLFLIGLWTEADDQGVFEWKPVRLKARILPADTADTADLLSELKGENTIARFEVDGKTFGAIRNFCKWQRPKRPVAVYDLPDDMRGFVALEDASEDRERSYRKAKCEAQGSRCAYCQTEITHYAKRFNSLELDHVMPRSRNGSNDDSNIVATCRACNRSKGDMTGEEFRAALAARLHAKNGAKVTVAPQMEDGGGKMEEGERTPHRPPIGGRESEDFFSRFWTAYPLRDGANPRKPARDRFRTACKSDADPEAIIAGAESYRRQCEAKGIVGTPYVAQAATWLNQQRWLDDYGNPSVKPNGRLSPEDAELLRKHQVPPDELAKIRGAQA